MNLAVSLRYRIKTRKSKYDVVQKNQYWKASETAVIVCDMWDTHHCPSAAKRVCEMAPRMNSVLEAARKLGIMIVHSPAQCIDYYAGHQARRNAKNCPKYENAPHGVNDAINPDSLLKDIETPFDLTDTGCDCTPEDQDRWNEVQKKHGRNVDYPWRRQIDVLQISDDDFISENGNEIYNIFEHHGVVNVILVGVHTNACVLCRPYGLIQMIKNGKNAVLMRDMTDSICNPSGISHGRVNELVIEFIEKAVCPTMTSNQIAGGDEFRFKEQHEY